MPLTKRSIGHLVSSLITEKRHELVRFLRFCVVGVIGTAIDFGVFNLMHNVSSRASSTVEYPICQRRDRQQLSMEPILGVS